MSKLVKRLGGKENKKSNETANENVKEDGTRQSSAPHPNNNLEARSAASSGSTSGRGTRSSPTDQRSWPEAQTWTDSDSVYGSVIISLDGDEAGEPSSLGPEAGSEENPSPQQSQMPYSLRKWFWQKPKYGNWNEKYMANAHRQDASPIDQRETVRSRSQRPPSSTGALSGGTSTECVDQQYDVGPR